MLKTDLALLLEQSIMVILYFLILMLIAFCFGRELIKSKSTKTQKINELLYYLPKQPNWFVEFVTALKDPDCGDLSHFAKLLDPKGELKCADQHFGRKVVNVVF